MENKAVLSNIRPKVWTSWKSRIVFLLVAPLIWSTAVEGLQVIGGNVTVMQGETAILPCKLIDSKEKVTQIAWRKQHQPVNFYTILPNSGPQFVDEPDERFKFIGNFHDNNGSLQLSNVSLRDHGTYTCIFTLFPSGNIKTEIPLNLLVPPVISVKDNHPMLGNEEVCLISCIAAASKPPAEVKWVTDTLAEKVRATTNSTQHANGTTTTVSSLFGVPTREINEHRGQCVVNSASMSEEESLPFTIHVYFSPTEININKISEHSIECVTDANPKADFTWSRSNQSWPESAVRVEGGTLHFLSMTSHLNGLYQCEASDLYGKKHSHIYVYVSSDCHVCWTLFVLLLVLIALVVVVTWYMVRSRRFPRTDMVTRGEMTQVQTASSTPEENQCSEAEGLQTEVTLPQQQSGTTSMANNKQRSQYTERLNSIHGLY